MQGLIIFCVILFSLGFLYRFSREFTDLLSISLYGVLPLAAKHRATLENWSSFYRGLAPPDRKQFERRVKELLYEKDWIGKGIAVTTEMKVRIAGAAAQVTMGFDSLLLLHFSKIIIVPGEYLNKRTGQRHVGEVSPGTGAIVLSWANFQEDFARPTDAHNVGLHEMAHALWFENGINDGEFHFLQPALLDRWKQLAQTEIDHIHDGGGRFFRNYAGTNQAEFFAVAVEYFFEQPLEFKAALPELYGTLSGLLRQDVAIVPGSRRRP